MTSEEEFDAHWFRWVKQTKPQEGFITYLYSEAALYYQSWLLMPQSLDPEFAYQDYKDLMDGVYHYWVKKQKLDTWEQP